MSCLVCFCEDSVEFNKITNDDIAEMLHNFINEINWYKISPLILCMRCKEDLNLAIKLKNKLIAAIEDLENKSIANNESNVLEEIESDNIYCEKCRISFLNQDSFKTHNSKFHDTKKLIKHRQMKNSKLEYCWGDDGSSRKTLSDLYPYHPEKNERGCRICDKAFKTFNTLRNHLRKVHPKTNKFSCDVCGENFRNKEILQRHVNQHTGDRKFVCNFCGKSFFSQPDLSHHIQIHNNKKNYKCLQCTDKTFNTASSLRTHRLIVHGNREEWKYLCTTCGLKCQSKSALSVHMRRHGNTKEFGCHLCESRFITKSELNKHIDTHSALKRYKCAECNAEYKSQFVLGRHKQKKHCLDTVVNENKL